MATLVFDDTGITLEAPEGARLVDLADEHPGVAIPFSCRFANCGTCRVEILEGLDHCAPPGAREDRIARIFHDPPQVRLGCQLAVLPAAGVVRLRVMLRR